LCRIGKRSVLLLFTLLLISRMNKNSKLLLKEKVRKMNEKK